MIRLFTLSLLCAYAFAARTAPELRFLSRGQRLKIEGRLGPDGKLAARKIEAAPAAEDFEVEGLVREVNAKSGLLTIGPWTFRVNEKTKFENEARQPRAFSDVAKRKRVKVKTRASDDKPMKARSVRIYEHSSDTDLEVVAPVETLEPQKAELTMLDQRIRVDSRTEYSKIPGAEAIRAMDEGEIRRTLRRDDDEQHPDPIRIGNVVLGGRTGVEYERTHDLDLDGRQPDSNHWITPGAQLEISAPLGEFSEAYAKFQFFRPTYTGNDLRNRGKEDFNVKEAFLYVGNFLHRSLGLQVGRQRFRDRREWLYDDELDAVRLHFAPVANLKVELSAAKGLFGPTGSRADQYYFIGHSQYRLPGRRYVSGYFIKRNDLTPRDEDPIWFGLSSRGRAIGNLDYWAEFAKLRGRRGANLLRGHGFDVGASYRFYLPWQPTVAAGYGFGSGDANTSDGVDGNFRQTGLQDNAFRYNGIKRYRYYGVVLDPELNNLRTRMVDFGIRPSDDWSLNVNFHDYRQAVPARRLGDATIGVRPTGRDPRLGKEIDVVLAIRKIPNVDLNFVGGVFLPGPAFRSPARHAFAFGPEVRYYF